MCLLRQSKRTQGLHATYKAAAAAAKVKREMFTPMLVGEGGGGGGGEGGGDHLFFGLFLTIFICFTQSRL